MLSHEDKTILAQDSVDAARRLLGSLLIRELDGQQIIVKIVETEAYHQRDAASHSHRGRTPRTDIMFGPAGHLYVYFTYGMHYCMNVVTGLEGEGSAVLIRAAEPLTGHEQLQANRHDLPLLQTTNGPAKLCQALRVDKALNGHDLGRAPLRLHIQPPLKKTDIVQTTRIGITKDVHRPWRFYVAGNPYVSKLS